MPLAKIQKKIKEESDVRISEIKKMEEEKRKEMEEANLKKLKTEIEKIKESTIDSINKKKNSFHLQCGIKKRLYFQQAKKEALQLIFKESEYELVKNHLRDIYSICLEKTADFAKIMNFQNIKLRVKKGDGELIKKLADQKRFIFAVEESLEKNGFIAEADKLSFDYSIESLFNDFKEKNSVEIGKLIK
ncbi:MAG: hypothetical protein ACD_11C00084G0001 [uncultured bacterium]|nr:MAG: hypothetical protein ACD_11C00084G0001 [uncultured bacterium]HLD61565.1 hypothetical protein [Patescibacteria group bacterium]